MKIKKYEHFEVEDFMEDEYFRQWVFHPDDQSNTFWHHFIERYPARASLVTLARDLLQGLSTQIATEIEAVPAQRAKQSFQRISQKLNEGRLISLRAKLVKWSVAASILFLFGWLGFYFFNPASDVLTYTTGNGQRLNIMLPDSSEIQLNANSQLSYSPENWKEKALREVDLKGEAFFNVTKKAAGTKFIVHSGGVDVSVLGTEFNVRSRGENSEVVLAEGKIELRIDNQKIAMEPGDYISYSQTQKKVESKKVKPADYTAWKDGIVVFNKSLSEAAKDLEILYGVKFNIEKESLKNRLIQLSAPADSLEQVLEILEIMYSEEINIQLEKGQVRIY